MLAGSLMSMLILLGAAEVVNYTGDQVRIYDKSGAADGALGRKALPPLPVPIVDMNARGFPGVQVGSRTVYLKPSDVETRDFNTHCTRLAAAARPGSSLTARTDVGASAHVGTADMSCLPNDGDVR